MASIRKRGDKYQVQVRRIGQAHLSKTFHDLKDARAWARLMEVKADRGDLLSDPKVLRQTTLAQIVQRYRDTSTPGKRSSATEHLVLSAFLLHPICRRRLAELRTEDFAAYRDERLREVKPSTVRRQLAIIKHALEVARQEWGFSIRENPLTKLTVSYSDRRRERRLRPGELDRLLDAAGSCRSRLVAQIVVLAVETGMRRGEILAARTSDLDLESRALVIRESKNGHPRTVPLTNAAFALLQQVGRDKERIFPITANAFRLAWERLKKRAGIEDVRFHDLRHEAISRFFELGLTTPEVALISGHKDVRMLFRYAHPVRQNIIEKFRAAGLTT